MRWARARSWLVLALVLLPISCATPREETPTDDPGASSTTEVRDRGPTRAEREAARAETAGDQDGRETAPEAPPADVAHLTVVSTEAPITVDLHREGGWPGRALDPVLHVGDVQLTHYRHVGAEVLRFTGEGSEVLDVDADKWVQWGDDDASRLEVVVTVDNAGGSLDL